MNSRENNRINIVRNSCCSFCRQPGHTINTCNDEALLIFEMSCINSKNLLENTVSPVDAFKRWLVGKFFENSVLVKSFAVRRCGCLLRSNIQQCLDAITHYIFNIHIEEENNDFIPFSNENATTDDAVMGLAGMLMLAGYSNEYILDAIMKREQIVTTRNFTVTIEDLEKEEQQQNDRDCECSICFESYKKDKIVKLNCNHTFCGDCVIETIKTTKLANARCALCRADIKTIITYATEVINKFEK